MHPSLKKELKTQLFQVSTSYNLTDITFPSFTRTIGFLPAISAADVAYAISAILFAGEPNLMSSLGVRYQSSGRRAFTNNNDNLAKSDEDNLVSEKWKRAYEDEISENAVGSVRGIIRKFWKAYDALEK